MQKQSSSFVMTFSFGVLLVIGGSQPSHAADPVPALDAVGHHLAVHSVGQLDHMIELDGQPLLHDTEDETVGLLGPYTGQGHSYVLLAKSAGGNACEMQFQAVDLATSPARLSPVFGDCSPDVQVKIKGGVLHATTGGYTGRPDVGSPKIKGETVIFGDGKFTPAR